MLLVITLLVVVVVAGVTVLAYRRYPVAMALWLVLTVLEVLVLGVTFSGRGPLALDGPPDPAREVFNPRWFAWIGCAWLLVAVAAPIVVVANFIITALRKPRRKLDPGRDPSSVWLLSGVLLGLVVLGVHALATLVVLVAMVLGGGQELAAGRSPDGKVEVQFVQTRDMIGQEGALVYHRAGEFWWHSLGNVGGDAVIIHGAAFAWPAGSDRIQLLVDRTEGTPGAPRENSVAIDYDLREHRYLVPSYDAGVASRPAASATVPTGMMAPAGSLPAAP